jgi:hypothetical protein
MGKIVKNTTFEERSAESRKKKNQNPISKFSFIPLNPLYLLR